MMFDPRNQPTTETKSRKTLSWNERTKRWRGVYRGVRLSVPATKFDGTTKAETQESANQWFEQKKAEIDVR